jgi:hypothetical protein
MHYSAEVVKAVTDPYSGLPSRKSESGWTGLPDVADVREFCENEAKRRERYAHYAALPKISFNREARPPAGPGDLANVYVPPGTPLYDKMVERAKSGDRREWRREADRPGIFVALGWLEAPSEVAKHFKVPSDADLLAHYGRRER